MHVAASTIQRYMHFSPAAMEGVIRLPIEPPPVLLSPVELISITEG